MEEWRSAAGAGRFTNKTGALMGSRYRGFIGNSTCFMGKLWKVTRKHSHIDGLNVIVHMPAHKWNINGTYGFQIYSIIDEL